MDGCRHSETVLALLRLFSTGELNARKMQFIAKAVRDDGGCEECTLMQKFAQAGSYGVYSCNILRDVMRATRQVGLLASVCKPYKCEVGLNKHTVEIFLPHEIMTVLHMTNGGLHDLCLSAEQLEMTEGLGPLLSEPSMAIARNVQSWGSTATASLMEAICVRGNKSPLCPRR